MTEKEIIRNEIERQYKKKWRFLSSIEAKHRCEVYKELLEFIDNMKEKRYLESKDLQIGDWVLYDPNVFIEDEYEPYKMLCHQQILSGEDIDLAIEDCYYPIPLTEEILVKFGFSKNNGISDQEPFDEDEDGNKYYSLIDNRIWGWWKPNNTFYIPANALGNFCVEYVHELQHILRICGVEKEITFEENDGEK